MKELVRVRVQYATRQQCCKTHKRPLPYLTFCPAYYRNALYSAMKTLVSKHLPFFYAFVCLSKLGHLHVLPAAAPFCTLRDHPVTAILQPETRIIFALPKAAKLYHDITFTIVLYDFHFNLS
jgi:hypothetical protein